MIQIQLKKISLFHVLTIVSIIFLPLFIIFSPQNQTAYADSLLPSDNISTTKITVTAWALNVRESGDISSKIIDIVHKGDTFNIIQTKKNWGEIKLSGNYTGWINRAYVTEANESSNEGIEATVDAMILKVREKPGLSSPVVGKLKIGTQITIFEEQAGWAKIASSSGVQGWVYEYYITKNVHGPNQTQPVSASLKTKINILVKRQTTNKISVSHSSTEFPRFLGESNARTIENKPMQNRYELLKGKTIVLDPGHGGKDNGTTSQFSGTYEKTLNIATAEVVEQKLEKAGANVIMTRTDDSFIPLQQRADLSNRNNGDAFISFHYNWSNDPSVNGVIGFYYQKSKDNSLTKDVLNAVVNNKGLKSRGSRFENLNVLRNNSRPGTLIELGFLSNKQDDSVVESSDYREKVAQGIYEGLIEFFNPKVK